MIGISSSKKVKIYKAFVENKGLNVEELEAIQALGGYFVESEGKIITLGFNEKDFVSFEKSEKEAISSFQKGFSACVKELRESLDRIMGCGLI